MTTKALGLLAIGYVAGLATVTLAIAAAIAELERGKSMDAMLHALAARSWKPEKL